ncbi:MAG: DUF4342 domain-containing protein [Dehalogenimonas sp.]
MATEKFTVSGDKVLSRIKDLIREGNIRRVRLIHEGRAIIDIPLSVGAPVAAVGILAAPVLAAIGAFAALVTECTIEVEKVDDSGSRGTGAELPE